MSKYIALWEYVQKNGSKSMKISFVNINVPDKVKSGNDKCAIILCGLG
ncbi:hypothetical protein ACSVC9_04605 [Clostridium sp. LBM24168]